MSTVEAQVPAIFVPQPITFDVAADQIALLAEDYGKLTIAGVDDTKGYKAVRDARMHMRDKRLAVDKRRKELKADALEYGRTVEKSAQDLIALIEPIENRLGELEEVIDLEKKRLKAIREEEAKAATQARVDALRAVGDDIAFVLAGALEPAAYEERLAASTLAHNDRLAKAAAEEAERQRLVEEARVQREAELKRLAEQKAEQDKIAAELKAQQEALAAERKKLAEAQEAEANRVAEAKAAEERKAETARLKKQAEIDAKAKLEREEAARVAKEKKAEERRLAKEAKRPDKEKLEAFATMLEQLDLPSLADEEALAALKIVVADFAQAVRDVANGMDYEGDE